MERLETGESRTDEPLDQAPNANFEDTPTAEPAAARPPVAEQAAEAEQVQISTPEPVTQSGEDRDDPTNTTQTANDDWTAPPPAAPSPPITDLPPPPTPSTDPREIPTDDEVPDFGPLTDIQAANVTAGRVTNLYPDDADDIASIEIIQGANTGSVSVNPDNTLAIVLSDPQATGSLRFAYQVTYNDGTVENFASESTIVAGSQDAGWGQGDFYMLETDDAGDLIIETGDDHRPVYISGSADALSRADIAAMEGVNVSTITNQWLAANPEYGGSEAMALDSDAGMGVWYTTTSAGDKETSNWLLFEKGYTYEDIGRVINPGVSGEDELHPLHITSYGEGEDPVIDTHVRIFQETSENIVFSNVNLAGDILNLSGNNMIFEDVRFDGALSIQGVEGFTIRDSEQYDVVRDAPSDGGDYFRPLPDRIGGLYVEKTQGVLLEGNLWDHIGWVDGYAEDGEAIYGQPPSAFSQNVYLQHETLDVTFRDNITMRAAAFGAQLRGGGLIEDNLFLHNNAGVNFLGGDYADNGPIGNYTLFTGNVVTSAQYNNAIQSGAKSRGVDNGGNDSTLKDNIIAHLADPNDAADLAFKTYSNGSLNGGENAFYNDTVIYNWHGFEPLRSNQIGEQNTAGLNPAELDQTTIQIYARQLLNDPDASIADLADYLRAQTEDDVNGVSNADIINAFFQQSFGISTDARLDAQTLRFIPNELSDGVRWDNRLNWDSEDLPGTVAGDSVDLGGNKVVYGGTNEIAGLDLGNGGELNVNHGKLTINGSLETGARGGTFNIAESGQVWTDGYADADDLNLNIDGGRFVNTGSVTGTTDTAITDGQAILATDGANFDVTSDSSLEITGSDARVGFDGDSDDTAVLRFEDGAKFRLVADEDGFATIEEFRSGRFGDDGDVQSGVNIEDSVLQLDVTSLGANGGEFTLIDVDGLVGQFETVELTGLDRSMDAELVVDYETDKLSLNIFASADNNSDFTLSTIGSQDADLEGTALWDALTANFPPLPEVAGDNDDVELLLVL